MTNNKGKAMQNEALLLVQIHQVSAGIIFLWAGFCVFAKRVNDGILGKLLFGMLMFAAYAVVLTSFHETINSARACVVMDLFVALVGVRHMWMKCIWGHIKAACERWAFCKSLRQWKQTKGSTDATD